MPNVSLSATPPRLKQLNGIMFYFGRDLRFRFVFDAPRIDTDFINNQTPSLEARTFFVVVVVVVVFVVVF